MVERLAALWAVGQPGFAAWHDVVDQSESFSKLTLAQFKDEQAKITAGIREREAAIGERRLAAEREAADRERAELEKSLADVGEEVAAA